VRLLAVWRIDLALSGSRGQSVEEVGNGYLLYVQGTGHGTGMSMAGGVVFDSGKVEVRLVVCVCAGRRDVVLGSLGEQVKSQERRS
jgi:glutamate synthase domain-containing protein 3